MAGQRTARIDVQLPTPIGVVDITPILASFYMCDSILDGGLYWSIKIKTVDWKLWDDTIFSKLNSPNMPVRVTLFDSGTASPQTTGWRVFNIDNVNSFFQSDNATITLTGSNVRLDMDQKESTKAFMNRRVSEVVANIADVYGLKTAVDVTLGQKNWYQTHQTDLAFLNELLHYSASDATGRGDIWFWVADDTLHFRALNYAAASVRKYALLSADDDRVRSVAARYYGREIDRAGGATFKLLSFDRDKGTLVSSTVNTLASAAVPSLGRYIPRTQSGGFRADVCAGGDLDILRARALNAWGRTGTRYFGLNINVQGDLGVLPGDMVEIDVANRLAQHSFYSGRYPVFAVEIKISGRRVRTTLQVYRREASAGLQAAEGADLSSSRGTDAYTAGKNKVSTVKKAIEVSK